MTKTPRSLSESSNTLWTPANIVTMVRICLVPVFVVILLSPWPQFFGLPDSIDNSKSLIAAGVFILISCTDWLDGYLARSRGEVTDFGKFMDPLADKILVTAALLALIELGSLPSWVVLIILTREFIVSGVRMIAANEGMVIAASWYGKAKTVFQMIAVVLFTIKDSYMVGSVFEALGDWLWVLSWVVMIIALIFTMLSMIDYISRARHLIGFSKKGTSKNESPLCEKPLEIDFNTNDIMQLADKIISKATEKNISLGTAESLTGGLIAATLTSVAGSSQVMRGGIVSYATEVKQNVLQVDSLTIKNEGVVSEKTARDMVTGAQGILNCDVCIAVTGLAGPTGGTDEVPIGTVWLAVSVENDILSTKLSLSGSRDEIRSQTVSASLEILLTMLEKTA